MSWSKFIPAKKVPKKSDELPLINIVATAGSGNAALLNKSAREVMGWESGLTFDLWTGLESGKVGITVYQANDPKQGEFICSARGARELTDALRSLGSKVGTKWPVAINEDKLAETIKWVARKVAS